MALTYKTEKIVEKINLPVICVVGGTEAEFESGNAMYAHDFYENYLIKSISIRNEKVVIELEEWQQSNIGWIDKEVIRL